MAVPTGPLTLGNIQTEFGGSNPISLSEYYRGGSFVPSGTTSSYGTIPTSGAISMGVFRGTVKDPLLALSNHTIYVERTAYGGDIYNQSSALASLTVTTDGQLIGTGSTTYTSSFVTATGSISIDGNEYFSDTLAGSTETVTLQNWLSTLDPNIGANYSIRMRIVTSGTPDGVFKTREGTYNTWLPMTSERQFTVASYSSASSRTNAIAVVCALEIALTSNTSNILKSCSITLWTSATSQNQQNLD